MRALQRWTMGRRRGACVALAMFCAASALGQVTTENWWTGGGDGTSWSDAANWTNGVPDTNHLVRLGYQGDHTNVPDVAQNIYLASTQIIARIQFDCDGNRAVTLSGTNLYVRAPEPEGTPYGQMDLMETATADATINLDLLFQTYGSPTIRQYSTNATLIVGPEGYVHYTTAFWGTSGNFLNPYGAGLYRIEGRWGNTSRCYAPNWVIDPAPGVPWSISGFSVRTSTTMTFEEDARIASRVAFLANLTFLRGGTGDRVVSCGRDLYNQDYRTLTLGHADDAGPGHLTLNVAGLKEGGPYLVTTNDTSVEFVPSTVTSLDRHIQWANNAGITGPGNMRVNTGYTFDVYRQLEHTGGTSVSNGTLRLMSYGVDTNGALPDTGMVLVSSNGVFDLNGIDDAIGGLGGDGEVRLGGAALTVTEGFSPGMSVGMLSVTEPGTVTLAGASVFEIAATNEVDTVVIPDADLTLGGTLNVEVLGEFKDEYYGDYVIVSLTNGTISGAFTKVEDNFNGYATTEVVGNDLVLTVNRPKGTAITIQ